MKIVVNYVDSRTEVFNDVADYRHSAADNCLHVVYNDFHRFKAIINMDHVIKYTIAEEDNE